MQTGIERGSIVAPDAVSPVVKDGVDAFQQHLKLRAQWVDISPEKAGRWLENNRRNRPVSKDVVDAYARDMIARQWVPTHQGIAFNDKDELIDGQHRLQAIVKSGVTVRMMVTFGLPSVIAGREMTTMDCVDRGRPRSVADQLKIQHGMRDGGVLASMCAALASLCCGERTRRLSVGQTLDVFRAFEEPVLWVIQHKSKLAGLRSAGVLAAFAFAIATEGKGRARAGEMREMFARLNGEEELAERSAMGKLRAFLTSEESKLFTPTLNRGLAELTLEAIRLELIGEKVSRLEMDVAGVKHFKALQAARVEKIAGIFRLEGTK